MRPAFLLLLLLSCAAPFEGSSLRPNILLVLVDDLGWQDSSVPFTPEATPLNHRWSTPHLLRLAQEGIRFTNAYAAAPVCTPTRTSILTGQSPGATHITYWTQYKDTDTSRAHPTLQPPEWNMNGLDQNDVTLSGLLAKVGYQTIHVGKAHFGAKGTAGADPLNLGFTVNIAGHAAGAPGSYLGTDYFSAARRAGNPEGKTYWDVPGLEPWHGRDVFLTEALAEEAAGAIKTAVAAGKPFFMNFAPYAVHAPIMANPSLLHHYDELDEREAAYGTMIESVDRALGTLMTTLEELGVLDQTVIVLTSDNGGLSAHARGSAPDGTTQHHHNAPLKSGKGSAYEGGLRVPMIARWPGVVSPGQWSHTPVISQDLFPTFLAWAGITIPPDTAPLVEGIDFTPLLLGDDASRLETRDLFWHQPHQWGASGPGIWPFSAVRHGQWKLIYRHGDQGLELYNLESDIGEAHDLAKERPDITTDLAERLSRWIEGVDAQMSLEKEGGRPIPLPRNAGGEGY